VRVSFGFLFFAMNRASVPAGAATVGGRALPNVKSAEKRMRTSAIRADRNRQFRSKLRTALKKARGANDTETANAAFREAASLLDRAARKRIIHPNKAARAKSRLTARIATLG
jgi:small subunit ribosomal protein S20